MSKPRRPATHTDANGRVCTECRLYKPWADFYAMKTGVNGRHPRCKTCDNERRALLKAGVDLRDLAW